MMVQVSEEDQEAKRKQYEVREWGIARFGALLGDDSHLSAFCPNHIPRPELHLHQQAYV